MRLLGQPDPITAEGVGGEDGAVDAEALATATTTALTAVSHSDLVAALVSCPVLGMVSEACYVWAEKVKDKENDGEKVPFFDGASTVVIG